MKLSRFYKTKENNIQCQICNHYCLIGFDKTGICGVKKNINGQMYSMVYERLIAENIDPIEKKPLFHFLPGSSVYSIATVGCNFKCFNCQNADISQIKLNDQYDADNVPGIDMSANQVVNRAISSNCNSIAYTYTEPTVFAEYALDCMKLAHENNLKNVWVSNGYMSNEILEAIIPYLDAINVDLKFFNNDTYLKICGAKLQPILDNLITLKNAGVWLEVTTLVIQELNDSNEELTQIANFIVDQLGADTPWHVSKFYPQYKMHDKKATDEEKVINAYYIGKNAGLDYVYAGNMGLDKYENTYCPKCQNLIIERTGYILNGGDNNWRCSKCDYKIDVTL